MVPILTLKVPSQLPYRLHTKTGFAEVNELDLSSPCVEAVGQLAVDPELVDSALGFLTGLTHLNLANIKLSFNRTIHTTFFGPSMTSLTYLSLANTDTGDFQVARLAPFLLSLTDLDLQECTRFARRHHPGIASLTTLTRLDLSRSKVGDAGMEALAPLTALTRLDLDGTAVTNQGLNWLAPLAAHLSHFSFCRGPRYGDREMIAVSSLTALTRLQMVNEVPDYVSDLGLGALSSLTSLVHFELN
jgi:hypothetical protein